MKYIFKIIWIIICFLTYLEYFIVFNILGFLWDFKKTGSWAFDIKHTKDRECTEIIIALNIINLVIWLFIKCILT